MNTTIRLRIKKGLDPATENKIIRLKGGLIAQSFTDIIHFDDESEDYYIHYFTTETRRREEVSEYITACIANDTLSDAVMLLV